MSDEIPEVFIQQPSRPDNESREFKRLRKAALRNGQILSRVASGKFVLVGADGASIIDEFDNLSSVAKFLDG